MDITTEKFELQIMYMYAALWLIQNHLIGTSSNVDPDYQ